MEIHVTEATARELIADATHLFSNHYEEVEQGSPGIKAGVYIALENAGMLRCVAARDEEGVVVGYAVVIVAEDPHSGEVQGECTALYVSPSMRHTNVAPALILAAEEASANAGAGRLIIGMKKHRSYHSLAKSMGYDLYEYKYAKRI